MEPKTQENVYTDILERRLNGASLDELVDEFSYLTRSEINNIIADLDVQSHRKESAWALSFLSSNYILARFSESITEENGMLKSEYLTDRVLELYRDGESREEIKEKLSTLIKRCEGIIDESDVDIICDLEDESWNRS